MQWSKHIDKITAKANSTLGFLRRNLRVNSQVIKARAYNTLVRPTLEYASTVWDPADHKAAHKIEMVQRRAARYVTGRYRRRSSVGDMLTNLQWTPLETRREDQRLAMMYKISHGLVAIDPAEFMAPAVTSSRRINNTWAFFVPRTNTEFYRNSYFPRTVRAWNLLPETAVSACSLPTFKTAVAAWRVA